MRAKPKGFQTPFGFFIEVRSARNSRSAAHFWLRILIGVFDSQSLGLGSLQEIVIGGDEDEWWQVI